MDLRAGMTVTGGARRMLRRALPALLLAAAVVPGGIQTADARAATGLTVYAKHSGYTTVRLARDLPLGDPGVDLPAHLTVSDPAHFVGVALVNTRKATANGISGHLSVMAMALPNGSGGYRFEQRPTAFITSLPRGSYWLVVLATAPERISWSLPVAGTYTVTRPISFTTTVTSGHGPIATSYGHAPIGRSAEFWAFVWAHGQDLAFSVGSVCLYDGADSVAVQTEAVPAPACDGSVVGSDSAHAGLPSDIVSWTVSDAAGPGSMGVKIADDYAGYLQWTAGRQIWIDLPA